MPVISVDTTETALRAPAGPVAPGSPIWVEARPNLRRIHVLAGDILAALGKRRDLAGKGRNESQDVALAVAWLRANHTRDLVITEAGRLHPLIVRSLIDLADRAGTTLWLLHAPPRSDAFDRILTRRAATTATPADVPRPGARTETAGQPTAPLPAVPAADFTVFRATYQRQLPPCDAARVEHRFRATVARCDAVLGSRGATADTVADLVHALLNPAPADPELTVDIRALQVAAWHHDLYVKINLPRLLRSEERPRLTAEHADAALLAYRQPYRTVTAALTRAGHGVADIAQITLGDVADDGHAVTCNGIRTSLGPDAARAVRAQRHLRTAEGADGPDPLLPHTPKALAKALTEARIDLGIHLHGRRAERTRSRTAASLRPFGITVTDLS